MEKIKETQKRKSLALGQLVQKNKSNAKEIRQMKEDEMSILMQENTVEHQKLFGMQVIRELMEKKTIIRPRFIALNEAIIEINSPTQSISVKSAED